MDLTRDRLLRLSWDYRCSVVIAVAAVRIGGVGQAALRQNRSLSEAALGADLASEFFRLVVRS